MEARPWKKSAKESESTLSSSSSSCSIANIPDPILMEILCRVPIKTLAASKSVCKSWLNLIKDPHFLHLRKSRAPTEVYFQPYHPEKDHLMKLHLGNFDFPNNLFPFRFELPKSAVANHMMLMEKLVFANSCNGLLCYYGNSPRYRFALVWNPCTSEFITNNEYYYGIPGDLPTCLGYGLGFSSKSKKFKLLRLMGPVDRVVADVCTIEKACSWKRIGPCSSHAWFRDYPNKRKDLHAVFLKGTLHWVVRAEGRDSCSAVHTFDFEDDRFGRVPLPHCLSETRGNLHRSREDTLGVLGGCLFIADHRNNKSVTIWLMKEYGVQDSWTKLFSLGSTFEKGLRVKYNHCLPITYMDSGAILMKCTYSRTSNVIIYNPVLKSARVMGSCPVSIRVIAYIPSLVMLKDSMLGYIVHAIPRCPLVDLERRKMSRALDWWIPVNN